MANHSKVRTEAEAKFRRTLKATWKGKKVTTPYEVEARVRLLKYLVDGFVQSENRIVRRAALHQQVRFAAVEINSTRPLRLHLTNVSIVLDP
jgi:hypothetical protein